MSAFSLRMQATQRGPIALIAEAAAFEADRPVVVFIHGALRHAGVMVGWAPQVAAFADPVFVDLPGHGRSPPQSPPTIENFAAGVAEAVRAALPGRRLVIVGESLGGLVAIAMAGLDLPGLEAVVAGDPPFTSAKQWQLYDTFLRAYAQAPDNAFMRELGHEMFGIAPGVHEERIRYPLLEAARAPVHIVTGDLKLQPRRPIGGVGCLVDEADRFVLDRLYADKAQTHVFPGAGHLVFDDQRALCLELLRGLIEPTHERAQKA